MWQKQRCAGYKKRGIMIRELPITELTLDNEKTIWDVRDRAAYAEGHVQGATNQPLTKLNAGLLADIPDAEPIYVLCGGGTKAGKAAALLEELDNKRDIVILTGGTRAAKAAGMPIETEV
jgi:rhodanese-related sulfurtransferase